MDWVHCKSVQTTPNYGVVKLGTILGRFGDPRLSIGPLKSPDIGHFTLRRASEGAPMGVTNGKNDQNAPN